MNNTNNILDIYKFVVVNNNDILLEKVEININDYIIENLENGNKLLKKRITITVINDIKKYNFSNSIILSCTLNNIPVSILKYSNIMKNIYDLINDGTTIIKNTIMNIKTIEINISGFHYYKNLGISIQSADSNKTLLEIIKQCTSNNIFIDMEIKLNNNEVLKLLFQ